MATLEFLVPDALVPGEFAGALLRELEVPNLALLAARGRALLMPDLSSEGLITPAQAWVLRNQPGANLAAVWAEALGRVGASGHAARWMIEPAHYEIGHSELVLSDPAELGLTDAEGEELAEVARPLLADAGWELDAAAPDRWFLDHGAVPDLKGASVECAIGQSVGPWMPIGDPGWARRWRLASNEIQMTWFTHPINRRREAEGRPVVNALWLTGNGRAFANPLPYSKIQTSAPLWSRARTQPGSSVTLETFEDLVRPARIEDWGIWREALQELDRRLGERILQLRAGTLNGITVVMTSSSRLRAVHLARGVLWKFWQRGNIAELFAV